jgi:hypothetical protein
MRHRNFTPINRCLVTAEQMIVLYFDPISLFPLQVYYIVAALADLSGKPLDSRSDVLVHRCGPASDSEYRFPVSELQSSLESPGPSQGRHFEMDSGVLGILADVSFYLDLGLVSKRLTGSQCSHWLSNSDLGAFHLAGTPT